MSNSTSGLEANLDILRTISGSDDRRLDMSKISEFIREKPAHNEQKQEAQLALMYLGARYIFENQL